MSDAPREAPTLDVRRIVEVLSQHDVAYVLMLPSLEEAQRLREDAD
jgi:hypothetical protein